MKRLIMLVGMFLLFSGFTLNWQAVTTYTDNTVIGSEANGVFYNVEMDGSQTATKIAATSWAIPAVAKKSSHTFRAQTVLGTGEVSAWTTPFVWSSPQGSPAAPSGMSVTP